MNQVRPRTANGANKKRVLHVQHRCGSLSTTIQVSHLANEFGVRRAMHEQVSLAAVNQVCVIHEAMNGCKNLDGFENVNINEEIIIASTLDKTMLGYVSLKHAGRVPNSCVDRIGHPTIER